jgi:hypothetical protein
MPSRRVLELGQVSADLVILTVHPEEYAAALSCLRDVAALRGTHENPNTHAWRSGSIWSSLHGAAFSVAVGKGTQTTSYGALAAKQAIQLFAPSYIVFVGVGGGFDQDGQRHGDVAVSSVVHGYDYGKVDTGGFSPRGDFTYRCDAGLVQAASAATGAWSRAALALQFGDPADDKGVSGVMFHSRTSLVGHYAQDANRDGTFLGLGTGFTYRRDRLAAEWDRVMFAHLLGPQLQLVSRSQERDVRWDFAAYADFAILQAHVFATMTDSMQIPHHIADWRGYAHAALGYRLARWSLSLGVDNAVRRGTWQDLARSTFETTLGVSAVLAL